MLNCIVLITKRAIYNVRKKEEKPHFSNVEHEKRIIYTLEQYKMGIIEGFDRKWKKLGQYYDITSKKDSLDLFVSNKEGYHNCGNMVSFLYLTCNENIMLNGIVCLIFSSLSLRGNYTMNKTEAQIVSRVVPALNPPTTANRHTKSILLFKHLLTDNKWRHWERPF